MFSTQSSNHEVVYIPLQTFLKKAFSYLKAVLSGYFPFEVLCTGNSILSCQMAPVYKRPILPAEHLHVSRTHGHGELNEVLHSTDLFLFKKDEIAWQATEGSPISITTLSWSWSSRVLRHMRNSSSLEMHILLWPVLVTESVRRPSSLPKALSAGGVQSDAINSVIWLNRSGCDRMSVTS